jgi:hypothetical protein
VLGDQAEDRGLAILDVQIEIVDHADRSDVLGDALEKPLSITN